MAATKVDQLFEQIHNSLKQIAQVEGNQGLDEVEIQSLATASHLINVLWDVYLDRQIVLAAGSHAAPEMALAHAGQDPGEVERARERVRAGLIERGFPLGGTKKGIVH